jgi:O-acetyl-ADP-ribose deacetylase (regulator of RNase III)
LLTGAPADGIVGPSNAGLPRGGGLAEQVFAEAGPEVEAECEKIFQDRGKIPVVAAVLTMAGMTRDRMRTVP